MPSGMIRLKKTKSIFESSREFKHLYKNQAGHHHRVVIMLATKQQLWMILRYSMSST